MPDLTASSTTSYRWPNWWRIVVISLGIVDIVNFFALPLISEELLDSFTGLLGELTSAFSEWPHMLTAFFLGLLVADFADKRSWVRHNMRHFRRVGDFQTLIFSADFRSLGDDFGGRQQFISISLPFKNYRKCRLDVIRYQISSADLFKSPHMETKDFDFRRMEGRQLLEGEVLNIPIAFVPVKPGGPACFVDFDKDMTYLSTRKSYEIRIEVSSRWKRSLADVRMVVPAESWGLDQITSQYFGSRFFVEVSEDT